MPVVLLGVNNQETEAFYSLENDQVINKSTVNIVEQINFIKHAKLNIGFEGFFCDAAISFNKKIVVKNNPPLHYFHDRNIRYLDNQAYNNMIILEDFTLSEFLPTLSLLKENKL